MPAFVLPSLLNLFMLVDMVLANIDVSPHPKPNALGETNDGLDRIPLFPFRYKCRKPVDLVGWGSKGPLKPLTRRKRGRRKLWGGYHHRNPGG